MTKPAKRPARGRPRGKRPVIATRVSEELFQRIQERAKASGQSMSDVLASVMERLLLYERALGEYEEWNRELKAKQAEIEKGNLDAELRRRNWRRDENGHWLPPEVHGLPPNGFVTSEEAAAPLKQTISPILKEALNEIVEEAVRKAMADGPKARQRAA